MSTFAVQWLKKNSIILFNTASLMGTMLVTSVLGFAYWIVAARYYPTESVGLASAATSAMMLLSTFFLLGQGTLLISELPRNKGKEGSLISAAVLLVGLASLAGGAIFAISTSHFSPGLRFLGASPQNVFLFALGVSLAAVTVILDQAVIGLLQGSLQLWRNTFFAVAKLVLLVVVGQYLARQSGISIYTTWTLGNVLSFLPILFFIIKKKKWSLKYYLPQWDMMRKLSSSALQHHALNLILQAPTQALPILVTVLLSATMNSGFYMASMIANFVFSLSVSLTTVLHAANAAQASTLTQKTRLTVSLSLLSGIGMGAILMVAAGPLLSIFGKAYATYGVVSLRILLLAAIPLTIKNHYIAISRIKDELRQAIIPVTVGAILELCIAAVGARLGGLEGLSLGWVIAMFLESLLMLPVVVRTLIGQSALDRYLDEIASTETTLLPALDLFQPSGAIYLSTFGNAITLTELDTTRLPRSHRRTQKKEASLDFPHLTHNLDDGIVSKEEPAIAKFPHLSYGVKDAIGINEEPLVEKLPPLSYNVKDLMMKKDALAASNGPKHGWTYASDPRLRAQAREAPGNIPRRRTAASSKHRVPPHEQPGQPEETKRARKKTASASTFHMPGRSRLVKQADIADLNTMQVQRVGFLRAKKEFLEKEVVLEKEVPVEKKDRHPSGGNG